MSSFSIANPERHHEIADHFAVSVDNYINSGPGIGMTAIEIAHSGLTIATKHALAPLTNTVLFHNAYTLAALTSDADNEYRTYYISEEVEDFCKRKNIAPTVAAKVGFNVLAYAEVADVSIGGSLYAYKKYTVFGSRKLDSVLTFGISPLNTIVMEQKRAPLLARINARVADL